MHYKIECFYNTTAATAATPADTKEMQQFMNFQRDFSATLKPYRTEWTVFHEEARIAGSIDMVYELIEPPATATATATARPSRRLCTRLPGGGAGGAAAVRRGVETLSRVRAAVLWGRRCRASLHGTGAAEHPPQARSRPRRSAVACAA